MLVDDAPNPQLFSEDLSSFAPTLVTPSIPGPRSLQLKSDLHETGQQAAAVIIFNDHQQCQGNFTVDADGNRILDLFNHIATVPVGYNHERMKKLVQSEHFQSLVLNRPALGVVPNLEFAQESRTLLSIAPKGLTKVQTMLCGSSANENAFKVAHYWKAKMMREKQGLGGDEFTQEELESCMLNESPGSPNRSILSFEMGFHGRTAGTLSATRSKAIHKVDVPAFDWPVTPFPHIQHPMDNPQNIVSNTKEEDRALASLNDLLSQRSESISALIVEPILSEGGDLHASPRFFKGVRDITRKHEVMMIVDEVQTGLGATGKLWAHEHWNLSAADSPDLMTFAVEGNMRIFNTWMGEPTKIALLEEILHIIEDEKLLDRVQHVGNILQKGLQSLAEDFPNELSQPRGQGTFCAIDAQQLDLVHSKLLQRGILVGKCGSNAIRLRPSLIFEEGHAKFFLREFRSIMEDIAAV
eukprot:g2801.t1